MIIGSQRDVSKESLLWDEKNVDYFEIGRSIRSIRAKDPTIKIGLYVDEFSHLSPADCVFLQLCRTRCDLFIVGIPTDYSLRLQKKRSMYPLNERVFRMGSMVYVNYIVPFDEETCSLCVSSVDPDYLFHGRTNSDEEVYSTTLIKEKITLVDYPWREERTEGKFFNL